MILQRLLSTFPNGWPGLGALFGNLSKRVSVIP